MRTAHDPRLRPGLALGTIAQVQSYLETYEYASRRHVAFALVREVGLRTGAVRAIDLADVDTSANVVQLRHRPEAPDVYGTPLKNREDGERRLNVSKTVGTLMADYIAAQRYDRTDVYDREPLLTTRQGRVSLTTLRRDFYKLLRPCVSTGSCPHEREVTTCSAATNANASACPSSYSPHPLRRWSIMHQLDAGVRKELLSHRVDVSVPVLEDHYDRRSEERKRKQRREELAKHLDGYRDVSE